MKKKTFFTKFEIALWTLSALIVSAAAVLSGDLQPLPLTASLTGVTALIFIAKGHYIGQLLTIVFSVMYGILSLRQHYYGEIITYLFMTAPIALITMIEWIRHPYHDTNEVEIRKMPAKEAALIALLTILVTAVIGFVLYALNTAQPEVSTLSVATSFSACALMFRRSPYYALAYAMNDIVLIVLWVLSALKDPSGCSVAACFAAFFVNDIYGFVNWRKMRKKQNAD